MSSDALKLYNTLTRAREEFRPLDPANVRMYVCGPTVYDYAHIGNARPLIVFDVLYRLLRHLYGADHVTYVRNITDVDDKINARAAERGISIRELTEGTNAVFQQDVTALGCLAPNVQPRATEHIAEMIALVERLIVSGHAYAADGHVLFDVPSMADYGRLSRRPLDEMIAGARVDVAPYKRGDMDFVLWKPSKDSEPGWDSPWGRGRPGWHLECSAMSWKHLGETFDIHGGGIDLVFPHHENEIAQTRCAFGHEVMANYWMHNGFLQVEGEKMSKSLGNFVTIHELLTGWHGRPWPGSAVRWAMLQTHYRQPIDWTLAGLAAAWNELSNLFLYARTLDQPSGPDGSSILTEIEAEYEPSAAVVSALADDLNTPLAIAAIREKSGLWITDNNAVKQSLRDLIFLGVVNERTRYVFSAGAVGGWGWTPEVTREISLIAYDYQVAKANNDIIFANSILEKAKKSGFSVHDRGPKYLQIYYDVPTSESESVEALIAARNAARAAKNWAESDRIRDQLAAQGIVLKDNKDGTTSGEVKR